MEPEALSIEAVSRARLAALMAPKDYFTELRSEGIDLAAVSIPTTIELFPKMIAEIERPNDPATKAAADTIRRAAIELIDYAETEPVDPIEPPENTE